MPASASARHRHGGDHVAGDDHQPRADLGNLGSPRVDREHHLLGGDRAAIGDHAGRGTVFDRQHLRVLVDMDARLARRAGQLAGDARRLDRC